MTANTDTADRFRAVITRAFSRATEEIGDQLDFDHKYQHLFKSEYDAAIGLIVSVRTADTLVALMTVYLELYARYAANANAVHFYRSDQVFVELIERTVKVPVVRRDLFREWAAALDGTTKRTDVTSLKPRFDALSVTARSRIAVFVEAQRERRRKSSSILDTLRAAYLATSGSAAASDEALRDFDPYPGDTFRSWFASRFDRVSAAWNSATKYNERGHRAAFDTAFDGFGDYLAGLPRRDPLPLFQILKFLRDRLTPQRETRSWGTVTRPGDTRPFVPELYVAVCMQLLVVANRELSLPANRVGFTPDELGFFLAPLQRNTGGYGSDVEHRVMANPDKAAAIFAWSKAHLDILLLSSDQPFQLVDLNQTLEIQTKWVEIATVTGRLADAELTRLGQLLGDAGTIRVLATLLAMAQTSVDTTGGARVLEQGIIRIGGSLGEHPRFGAIKVIDIDPATLTLYVEFDALKPFLFKIRPGVAQRWLGDARIMQVHRSTVGSIYIAQATFIAIGFLPTLVEAGFAGLVYEVGVYVGSIGVEEVVGKVNPTAGKVLGLLMQLLTPRKNLGPKVIEPTQRTVQVLRAEDSGRSLEELWATYGATAKLNAEFERSTALGAATHGWQSAKDKLTQIGIDAGELSTNVVERLPNLEAGMTDTGHLLRLADQSAARSGGQGGGGMRTGRGARAPRGASKLQRSKEYTQLDDYLPLLAARNKRTAQQLRNEILARLEDGTYRYGEARQQIVNLLNAAKETTGEYVADGLIYSQYKVHEVIDVARRTEEVPILDRVYVVEDHETGEVFYIFAEIKGGERTKLGYTTYQPVTLTGGELAQHVAEKVRQASPTWYYAKLVEISKSGVTALERRRNQALARELFGAAKSGKAQSFVIKSGRALDPIVRADPGFTSWFQDKVLPIDLPKAPL